MVEMSGKKANDLTFFLDFFHQTTFPKVKNARCGYLAFSLAIEKDTDLCIDIGCQIIC